MTHKTRQNYINARDWFFQFFAPDEQLDRLTQDRMQEWKDFLLSNGKIATATVAGTITKTKTVFNWAKKQKWLIESPLSGIGRGTYRNPDKN